jgi:hypothetical protein
MFKAKAEQKASTEYVEDDEKASIFQMFRTPNLGLNAFLCISIW